jgi:hypothetical protein
MKQTEKWGRYFTNMMQFLNDISANERHIQKVYKEAVLQERRKAHFGPFQSSAFEFLRTLEDKEKSHLTLSRTIDTLLTKIDTIVKAFRADEKTFIAQIQKIAKEVVS